MIIIIVKYILILIPVFFIQCKSVDLLTYNNSDTIKGNTAGKTGIKDKIDRAKTYEIIFSFKNDENCIKISMKSQVFEKSLEKNVNVKTFFIVEKLIDLSKFTDINKEFNYSEIAKNYDYNWNTKPEIDICSAENLIERLRKNNKYRIRFTAFTDRDFTYNIIIQSKNGVILSEKTLPE